MANHEPRPLPGAVPITPLVNPLQARLQATPQAPVVATSENLSCDERPAIWLGGWVAVTGAEPQAIPQLVEVAVDKPVCEIQPRWACLCLPDWPIQRLVVEQPALRRQRVVLFADRPPRGRLVTAASPVAQQAGVRPGMPVAEAKSLWKKNGNGAAAVAQHWLPADPTGDHQQLEQLADELNCFSPVVGLAAHQDSADGLWFEVTGLAHLFGDEASWLRQLLATVQARGYWAFAAIADTLGQAWAWAHYYPRRWLLTADSADAAGAVPSPDNATTSAPQTIAPVDLLHWLPPAALRLQSATCDTLQRLGIDNIAQLLRLPRASLAARFGREIYDRWDQFAGSKLEVIAVRNPPADYQARQFLEFPLTDLSTVEVIVGRLITQLCQQLQAKRLGAWQWRIQLDRQAIAAFVLQVDLYEPSNQAELIMDLVQLHLERHRQREILAGPIEEIQVAARRWVALGERQRQLFDEDPKPNQQALAGLVNRLVIRLGAHQVLRPLSVSGVQPEYARRYRSWVGGAARNSRAEPREFNQGLMARPVQLLSQPQPLTAVPSALSSGALSSGVPSAKPTPSANTSVDPALGIVYPPAALLGADGRYEVVRWWGPERVETGWWRGRPIRRDYWRIETTQLCHYWIYYDLQQGKWYLQGWF